VGGACPILDHPSEHKHEAFFDDLIDSLCMSISLGMIG
jgi:hypothetical protein